jgi:flagellar motor switch protein FliN/FliY
MTDTDLEARVGEDDWSAAMAAQAAEEPERTVVADPKPAQIFPQFADTGTRAEHLHDFDMILDIPVQLAVELGRTRISIRNLLQLAHGSVVELEALAGEPLDVLVNGTLIAQGEVVVVNDKFGIRLTDIITPSERMRKLKR